MKIPARNHRAVNSKEIRQDLTIAEGRGGAALRISALMLLISTLAPRINAQAPQPGEHDAPSTATGSSQHPPESREERLKQLREEKAKNLVPPKVGVIEKYAKDFDRKGSSSIEEVNFWGFHPRIDWIARGSGVAPGVRYWKPEILGPIDVMGAAFYSWRRYQHYELQLGLIPNQGKRIPSRSFATEEVEQLGDIERGRFSRFKLYVSSRFRDRTDESFYGSGPDSLQENRARYRIKDFLFEAVTGYQITKTIGFTFKAGLINNSLAPGRSAPPLKIEPLEDSPPGELNPPSYFRYQSSFLLDFRDDPGLPHKGLMVAFGWEKYDNVDMSNLFNLNRFAIDVRGYIPLGSNQQVIALRSVGVNSDPAPGNRTPFFLQPSLGGGESLRGYDPYRFQGDKMLLLQGEYRWEASHRFEFAIFGDTGTVSDQGTRLSVNKMKSDAGIGFRIKSSRTTLFRLDVARSSEGVHFQFRVSPVF